MTNNPKIQKTVPVRKNGYILELLVPSPETYSLTNNFIEAPNSALNEQSLPKQLETIQNEVVSPEAELPTVSSQNSPKSFTSLRDLFKR
jgi:hypothetical protein